MSNKALDPDVAIEQCETIVELIDEEVPESAYDKAGDFFDDVRKKVCDVEETITEECRVTENQQKALDNWEAAVRKWIRD